MVYRQSKKHSLKLKLKLKQVHQWLMTTYPEIVAEYIQFDDSDPFQPLQLECAVSDLSAVEDNHGKLTAIVRYWTQYKV